MDWKAARLKAMGEKHRQIVLPRMKLPALPRALTLFCKKAENPGTSQAELASIIESDTALAAELLRPVNSAQPALRRKSTSVQQTLTLLGTRNTKLTLITAGVKLALAARPSPLISVQDFWNANLERAIFAREVALMLKADADVAFAGAMLQDFLLPVFTSEMYDHYVSYFNSPDLYPAGLVDFEQQVFGWDHSLVSAHVLLDWGFPDELVCAVLHHHRGLEVLCDRELGRSAVAAVALSGLIPDELGQTPESLDQLQRLEQVWPAFKLAELAERVATQFAELVPGVTYGFSLKSHCDRLAAARPATMKTLPEPVPA